VLAAGGTGGADAGYHAEPPGSEGKPLVVMQRAERTQCLFRPRDTVNLADPWTWRLRSQDSIRMDAELVLLQGPATKRRRRRPFQQKPPPAPGP
jgi:hypothetical protein